MTKTRIAFLGLGAMGSRMAARLIDAGYALTVWNRSAAGTEPLAGRGAGVAGTPREAADGADMVITMLRDDAAAESVWLDPETGALAGMAPGALAIESSTLSMAFIERLAAVMADRGVRFLDAPVSGTLPHAENGQLAHLVGGVTEDFEAAKPVLAALGQAQHHVGAAGAGMRVKLMVNSLLASQLATMAEIVRAARQPGVDTEAAIGALTAIPVTSPAAAIGAKMMLAGKHDPLFPVAMVVKDLDYALAAAPPSPVIEAVRGVFVRGVAAGLGDRHMSAVVELNG